MQENGTNQRMITIQSLNPEWTCRLASKLLVGKGRWDLHWSENEVRIYLQDNHLPELMKDILIPILKLGIETTGETFYGTSDSLWHVWKEDFRFTDILLTEDFIANMNQVMTNYFETESYMNVEEWAKAQNQFNQALSSIEQDLIREGQVAKKLEACGWV